MVFRRLLSTATVSVCALVGGAIVSTTGRAHAQDGHAQSSVVSAVPAAYTPNINDGHVNAINQVGRRIIVGGTFTNVSNHGSTAVVRHRYLFAFDAASGVVDRTFVPALDGAVYSIEPGPSTDTVYVAGAFATVNGTKNRGIVLLSTVTGAVVSPFKAPISNGISNAIRLTSGHLLVGGTFTTVNGVTHDGIVSLNPTTGALDPFMNVQLTGHHNYNGTGANGSVGAAAMDVSPDGRQLIVIGDFKNANGVQHDQIVKIDLTGTSAVIDPTWNTLQYTAPCASTAFDSYVRDVNWAPDGSYFVVASTGGEGTNSDGTRGLCDSAVRWSATDTGTKVLPTWVDYTGSDSLYSVAVTGTAIYVGGHQRWLDNPNQVDSAGTGAVPRPGLAALDPANGLPLAWNPGRNPRGAGAYAMFASTDGLYVGSDTNFFGDRKYERLKLGFFPLAGGYVPSSTATAALPADIYQAGPTNSTSAGPDDLAYRSYAPPAFGVQTVVAGTGIAWSQTRGAFLVGSTLFYGLNDGTFHKATFNGTTVGASSVIDPYDDPAWDNVENGSGGTYRGLPSAYYGELHSVTGAFYSDGRLYYSQTDQAELHWRYFTPDSGIVGGTEFAVPGGTFAGVAGLTRSGSTIFYATTASGSLHSVAFSDGGTNGANPYVNLSTDRRISGPSIDGRDWRSQGLFLYAPN
jgi:hypothetical protein